MFGVNFFKKNTKELSEDSEISKSHQETVSSSQKNSFLPDGVFDELQDSVNIWHAQNEIEMKQRGISTDIATMFIITKEEPEECEDISFEQMKESPLQNDSTEVKETEEILENVEERSENKTQNENVIDEEEEEITLPNELLPTSETELISQVCDEYMESIFFDKAHEALLKRNVPKDKIPNALEDLFTKMAKKSVESFKGTITQLLNEVGLDEIEVANYIYWRLNEYTKDNVMYLVKEGDREMLVADNFVTEELLEYFYNDENSTDEKLINDKGIPIVTSEKLDELLDDINNV